MKPLACALAIAAATAGPATAIADNAKADDKFKQGKKMLAQKRYAEACQAFEESNRVEPGIGAQLNIGHCYEEWGKLATAYRAYATAEDMAKAAHDPRLAKIHERIEALDSQVPRLTIEVAKDATTAGLVVTLDGDPFAKTSLGTEMRVDPGPHKLEYRIGDTKRSKLIPLERGGSSDITLDLPHADAGAVAVDKPATPPKDGAKQEDDTPHTHVVAAAPEHRRHVEGVIALGAGAVGMGVAGVLTLSAHSKYKKALDADCGGSTSMCDPVGLTATHDARHEANVASVVFGVGAAVAATGIVVYVTAPHGRPVERQEDALRLVPVASPNSAGLVLLGRF